MKDAPVLGDKQWQGLLDILDILSEILRKLEKNKTSALGAVSSKSQPSLSGRGNLIETIEAELTSIYERVSLNQNQPAAWTKTLAWLSGEGWERVSHRLMELLESHPNLNPESLTELQLYLNLMQHHLQDMQRSLDLFAPWLSLLDAPPVSFMDTPAWQVFRDSLPADLPTLGQAETVYERILTALNDFKPQLRDAGRRWHGVKNWRKVYQRLL